MSTPTSPAPKAAAPASTPVASQSSPQTAKPGITSPDTAQATPQEIRKMKVKLEGREIEVLESEVLAGYQKGKVADQRFQEAAQIRRQAQEVIKFAKENPKEFFNKTGMNARQWAEEYLLQEIQNEAMSPEQRKARENEDRLRKYEEGEKQAKDKVQQEQIRKLEQEHAQNYDNLFTQALHESGLPKTAFTVKRMAELQLKNVQNKYELSASQIAKLVREDYINEQKSLLSAFDGNQLMDFLGPDTVKKLSKAQIAKLKAKANPVSTASSRKPSETKDTMTFKDWQKKNRGR